MKRQWIAVARGGVATEVAMPPLKQLLLTMQPSEDAGSNQAA